MDTIAVEKTDIYHYFRSGKTKYFSSAFCEEMFFYALLEESAANSM
jgi:hypothetical protein